MDDNQIQQELALRDQLIAEVQPIHTDVDRQQANNARGKVKEWLARFDAGEKRICEPIYRAWKNAKDEFKQGRAPAEAFLAALDTELLADRRRQDEAKAKEQHRLDALAQKRFDNAVAKGKPTALPVPTPAIVQDVNKTIATETGKVTWIDNYVPEIYDEKAIPRTFLMPDMTKISAAVKAGIDVDGVRRVNKPFQRTSRG